MLVVFDTSPLIYLARLGYLESALGLFRAAFVPKAVLTEIQKKQDIPNIQVLKCVTDGALIKKDLSNEERVKSWQLGLGETEAILLARHVKADRIILDDKTARKIALNLGLVPRGTLSILKTLEQKGILRESKDELYSRLRESNFRIKQKFFYKIMDGN